jgi:hypothetical protein
VDMIHCHVCDYGYYMLTMDESMNPEEQMHTDEGLGRIRSICVKKCEDFAVNYVSNPNTMKCECK